MNLSVTKVKTFNGHEGPGYNCDLLRDGVLVAHVINEGNGGEPYFQWTDLKSWRKTEEDLTAFMKTQPQWKSSCGDKMYDMTLDIYLERLISDFAEFKRIRVKAKKNTLYVTSDQDPGSYQVVNRPFSPSEKMRIITKHPTAVFLNEHLNNEVKLSEALKLDEVWKKEMAGECS